jgi:hypothetical protein
MPSPEIPDDSYALDMKHAGEKALERLEPLLGNLRRIEGLVEKRPGVFYRKNRALLHFHEDDSGLYADLRLDTEFERVRVETTRERSSLLAAVRTLRD